MQQNRSSDLEREFKSTAAVCIYTIMQDVTVHRSIKIVVVSISTPMIMVGIADPYQLDSDHADRKSVV